MKARLRNKMIKNHNVRTLNISNMKCPVCENMVPIPRPFNARKKDHKKWLYCPFCRKKRNMLEIRACDFDEEEKRFEANEVEK